MAVESVVIAYRADISNVKRQVILLQRLNKAMAKSLGKEFTKGASIVRDELTKITTSAKKIKLPLGGTTKELRTFTTVIRGANGALATVTRTVAGTGKNIKIMNTVVRKGATVARTMGQNLAILAKRAALTIPLWFALRQGVGAVFRVMKEGLTAIVDFDRALQKARRNLQGSAADIERNFGVLRKEVTKLSIETGRSVEDITNAFQKFATVGFDFETSLAGANNATKLSILLFGDVQETAFAFARSMRVLVDETKGAKPASEQLADVMALTAELWKTNAFELNELTQSLEKFAPVAKTAGFSAEETVKLLAALSTAGLRAGRGGRLLRTSIVRLVTSTDKLAKSLGIKVNPEIDRTFDIFLKTLDVLHKTRQEAGKVSPEFEKIVKSIFGLRSGDAVKGLIALRENLQKVLGTTGDVSNFHKEFNELNKTLPQLVDQFRNLNKEIGKAFVIGLVGGEDFRDNLEILVEKQKELIKGAKTLGFVFNAIGKSIKGTFDILNIVLGFASFGTTVFIGEIIRLSEEAEVSQNAVDALTDSVIDFGEKLQKGLSGGLDSAELERLINKIKTILKLDIEVGINKIALNKSLDRLQKTFAGLELPEPEISFKVGDIKITTADQNKLIQSLIGDQLERLKIDGATESQLLKIEDRLLRQFDIGDNLLAQKQRQLDIERSITEEQKTRITFSSESVKLAEIAKTEGLQTAIAISQVLSGQRDFNTFLHRGGIEAEILKDTFEDFVKNKQLEQFFRGERGFGIAEERGGQRISIRELGGAARGVRERDIVRQLEKAKFALGLRETTERNNSAIIQNTASLDTLIQLYKSGVQLTGTQAQRFVSNNIAQRQILDINVNVDGIERSFTGTPEAIRELANRVSAGVAKAVEEKIVNDLNTNNNSPISKATDGRIEKF